MSIFSPTIGLIEDAVYGWAKNKTEISIVRSNHYPLEIVLIFADEEDVFNEELLRRNVFKENWDPEYIEVIVGKKEVRIRLCPSGK